MVISHAGTGLHDITAGCIMTGGATVMDIFDCCTVCCCMAVVTLIRIGKLTVMVVGKIVAGRIGVWRMTGYTFSTVAAV